MTRMEMQSSCLLVAKDEYILDEQPSPLERLILHGKHRITELISGSGLEENKARSILSELVQSGLALTRA
jgi:hypothetical protein